jgi:hypothetical protein
MNIHRTYIAVGLIIALSLFLGLVATLDEADQAATVSFQRPDPDPGPGVTSRAP